MDIVTILKRRFALYFSPKDEATKALVAFAGIAEMIKRRGPAWYDPWSNEVKPALATEIIRLRDLCAVPGRILSGLEDRVTMERRERGLLEAWLRSKELTLERFSFDSLDEELRPKGGDVLSAIDAAFRKRLEAFKSKEMEGLAKGWDRCLRLAALSGFDFPRLLSALEGKPGKYRTVSALGVCESIDDLRFLADGLDLGADTRRVLEILAATAEVGSGAIVADGARATAPDATLETMAALFAGPLKPERLGDVVKAILMEPSRKHRAWSEHRDLRKSLYEELVIDYKKKRATRLESMASLDLDEKKRILFGDDPLQTVQGYSEERNGLFAEHRLPAFRRILPLRIVKTFATARFGQLVDEPVSAFIVAFESESREFADELGNSHAIARSIGARIASFEEDILSPARSVMPESIRALTEAVLDNAGKRRLSKAIEEADGRADEIVQTAFSSAANLHGCLEKILVDLKASHPLLIGNAKSLVSGRGDLVDRLGTASTTLFAFLKLLRAFSVDVKKAKEALR
jgi:hypothetical protein